MKPTQGIIDELRDAVEQTTDPRYTRLLTDAADRIEYLFDSGIHTCHADCQRPMCVLRRERDKAQNDLARVTAELEHHKSVKETTDAAHRELSREHAAIRARVTELKGSLKAEIECRNGWWDRCEKAEAALAELEANSCNVEELRQARLERDNAKTCEAIHFGAVRWLERYVKLLKIELHRQELANLRKKRTIRGLRKERAKMREVVKEACNEQLAKINAARPARMEGKRRFRLILVGHRTVYGVPVHSGNRLEEWCADLGGGIWHYVDAFPSREDAESYVKNCGGALEVLP